MIEIFTLLIIYQIKHFLCDYPLQIPYMLQKISKDKWILPLASHAGVHALFTLIIVLVVNANLWWLAIFDFVIHFTMDRIKASPNLLNRFEISNKFFWWSLGFDQMVHHLTHYVIIFALVTY